MIAISYRREDSQSATGRLYDCLRMEFGHRNIFRDFDSIPYGSDFRQHIEKVLSRSEAIVVVIGAHWLGTRPDGSRRLDDPGDFVRLEIATALQQNTAVFPVLLDDTQMPAAEQLPDELRQLGFKNALRLDTGPDFHFHVRRLVRALRRLNLSLYTSGRAGKLLLFAAPLSCIFFAILYFAFQRGAWVHVGRMEPELLYFLEKFVAAGSAETGEVEAECYTEPALSCYDEPGATHEKILAMHLDHVKKWPTRFYKMVGEPLVLAQQDGNYMIQVNIHFNLANAETEREGEDMNFLHIKKIDGRFKIYSSSEVLVRDIRTQAKSIKRQP